MSFQSIVLEKYWNVFFEGASESAFSSSAVHYPPLFNPTFEHRCLCIVVESSPSKTNTIVLKRGVKQFFNTEKFCPGLSIAVEIDHF